MDEERDRVRVEYYPSEEVFGLLGNETRVAILRALAEDFDEAMSFSELRTAVGTRDSGKFNYHLKKLVGHFVRNDEDGYRLTLAGRQVMGAILSGTYTADAEIDPIELDDPCPNCGERALVVEYERERVETACRACEQFTNTFTFPPGAVSQYPYESLPEVFDRWLRSVFERIDMGFCPTCSGRMDGRLEVTSEGPEPARARYECCQCSDYAESSPTLPLLYHPAVLGFYWDHGVDLTATPSWRIAGLDLREAELVSEDPPRVRMSATVDGETLVAEIDADLEVVEVERSDR